MKRSLNPKRYYQILIYCDQDFKEIENLAIKMFQKDKNILNSIPDNLKQKIIINGIRSYGIRYLVNQYVNMNKSAFLSRNKKEEKIDEIAIT